MAFQVSRIETRSLLSSFILKYSEYPKALLLNMLSRLVITFLPRSKHLLISWLQSPSAVILEPPKIKSDTVSTVSPSICYEVMGPDAMILVFWMLSFKPTFSLSFIFIKRLFYSSLLSSIRVMPYTYLRLLLFFPWVEKNPGEGNGNSLQYFAWENPWRVEPGMLQSIGLTKDLDTT